MIIPGNWYQQTNGMNDERMLLLYMANVKLKIQIYNGHKDLHMIICCSEILEIEEGALELRVRN
jgi:hypothetical protein